MGTNIHRVLMFVWVLLHIQEIDNRDLVGTYIHRVLVIDGYLYSRVYGIQEDTGINLASFPGSSPAFL